MSDGITRGILEAHRSGIVTSATVMTNVPWARRGIERALTDAPALGLGLHVNLTYGAPVLPPEEVPSLVGADGAFLSARRGVSLPHLWNRRDLEAEVAAQLERFVTYAGRPPDHLDTHQLVSTFSAPCREVLVDLAARHGLALRRGRTTLYGPFERLFREGGAVPEALRPVLGRIGRPWRRPSTAEGPPLSTDGLELRFFGARATTDALLRILDDLPEGFTELVCHPGYADADTDDYAHREAELAALTDPRVKAKVASAGVELVTFAHLAPAAVDVPGRSG